MRAILNYAWVGQDSEKWLHLQAAWEDSWHPAEDFAGHTELEQLQQRMLAAGDTTDVVAIAQQQAAEAAAAGQEEEEMAAAPRGRRQRGDGGSVARGPTPAA